MIKRVIVINGIVRQLVVDAESSLATVIRNNLNMTGTKVGCDQGQCGACSVLMDGKVIRSCATKMKRVADGAKITTIEGIGTPDNLHPLQMAWMLHGGAQCGFCTPGFVLSIKALLADNPSPTRDEARQWFTQHHNACRCTGYKPLVDSVMEAAKVLRGEMTSDDLAFKCPTAAASWGTKYPRPRPSPRSPAPGTSAPTWSCTCRPTPCTWRWCRPRSRTPTSFRLTPPKPRKCPAWSRSSPGQDIKGKNRITGLITFPTNKGDGWDRPILCDTKVFQYGDAIAIVCADTPEQAQAAAEKVKVELEELPSYMSAPAAMAEDAIEIHPGTPNVYYEQGIVKGDETAPIFAKAAHVVEGDYYVSRQPHLPIEPDVGFAYIDDDGKLTIHSKSSACTCTTT